MGGARRSGRGVRRVGKSHTTEESREGNHASCRQNQRGGSRRAVQPGPSPTGGQRSPFLPGVFEHRTSLAPPWHHHTVRVAFLEYSTTRIGLAVLRAETPVDSATRRGGVVARRRIAVRVLLVLCVDDVDENPWQSTTDRLPLRGRAPRRCSPAERNGAAPSTDLT